MPLSHALLLGIVQGLTEFLPISSSGHLFLIPHLLGWSEQGLAFDVALNTGTFLAALIYFFPVWWKLLTKGLLQRQAKELKLLGYLILATIPAALVGLLAQHTIENTFRQPYIVATMLIVFGLILGWAERRARLNQTAEKLTWPQVLGIGVAQALALIPGVSRSGITMTAGLLNGLTKKEAAEFSFLLLAPISFGAALTQFHQIAGSPLAPVLVGMITSFVVGLAAIHGLLTFVKKAGFAPYVWYRVVAGTIFLILLTVR